LFFYLLPYYNSIHLEAASRKKNYVNTSFSKKFFAISKKVSNFAPQIANKRVAMNSLESFEIDLKGMTEGERALAYTLDDDFFKTLCVNDVQGGALHVSGSIRKANGFFELHLAITGTVTVSCDRCLDPMSLPISTSLDSIVKLSSYGNWGDEPCGANSNEDDGVIIVDEKEGILSMAWPIYETVALAIPIQHVHAPGKCNPAMTKALEELSAARSSDEESCQATIDPRWSALLNLKNKSKQ